jgi:hypothetical protein
MATWWTRCISLRRLYCAIRAVPSNSGTAWSHSWSLSTRLRDSIETSRRCLAADRIDADLKSVRKDAKAIIEAYIKGIVGASDTSPLPWYMLDRHHRHLEHRYTMLNLRLEGQHARLEQVMAHVRRRYAKVVGQGAERLAEALALADFDVAGLTRQDDAVRRQVHSRASEGKTAYVLVDALGYEMGLELIEGLGDEFDVDLGPAMAQLPTVTEVGMRHPSMRRARWACIASKWAARRAPANFGLLVVSKEP